MRISSRKHIREMYTQLNPFLYTNILNGIHILCSIRFSVVKIQNFQIKKIDIFLIFCSIHRLWVHIRTVSARRYITRTCYADDKHRKRKRKRNLTWHYSTISLRKPVHATYSIVSAVLIKISRFFYFYFSYNCSKHRLWVHVRTASLAEAVLTSTHNLCFRTKIKNKKNMYTPAYPYFTIQKWGLVGYTFHGHVFMMYSEIM